MPVSLIIIAHNIRSAHNIGALLRTADGLGVSKIYFTGYTPFPKKFKDERLPHITEKINKRIDKTALGAQHSVSWDYEKEVKMVLKKLKNKDYILAGLEQKTGSISLPGFEPPAKLAILLGSEVTGIDDDLLTLLDCILEIPMHGAKESFNVVEAATIAMYHCLALR